MKSFISVLTLALAAGSFAGTAFFSGSLTASSPTFNRPFFTGDELSDIGQNSAYSTQVFSVSATGEYTFETLGLDDNPDPELDEDEDPFTIVYRGGFDPLDPLRNIVGINDDWFFTFELLPSNGDTETIFKSKIGDIERFSDNGLLLDAGVNYFAVTTSYKDGQYFDYQSAIGPTNGTIGHVTLAPVPEPASMLALAGGVAGLLARRKKK